jgi:hypothetical protein
MTLLTAVQEHSSAKQKEMWKTIQMKANSDVRPVQLILDMKVRWSSTYMMLDCAERKREVCSKLSAKDSNILFVSHSMLMPSWMSFVGKNKTWQNMINSMS